MKAKTSKEENVPHVTLGHSQILLGYGARLLGLVETTRRRTGESVVGHKVVCHLTVSVFSTKSKKGKNSKSDGSESSGGWRLTKNKDQHNTTRPRHPMHCSMRHRTRSVRRRLHQSLCRQLEFAWIALRRFNVRLLFILFVCFGCICIFLFFCFCSCCFCAFFFFGCVCVFEMMSVGLPIAALTSTLCVAQRWTGLLLSMYNYRS